MNLYSYPYLIQKEILNHLSINQLFFLSLCSKNTKHFIKQTQKHQLEKCKRVIYSVNDMIVMRISVKMADDRFRSNLIYLCKSTDELPKWMITDSLQEVRVNVLATPIDFFRSTTKDSELHAKYSPDTFESMLESIHNQLYDLLGNHTKFWMQSFDYDRGEGTHFLPLLHNIEKIDIFGKGFESTKIDEFLDRSTCLEHFAFGTVHDHPNRLREDSKLYDLDTVYVYSAFVCACPMANDVLKRFKGRHAFLDSGDIKTADVIQFLNEWKSGEKFKNLELISMDYRFNLQEIRSSVEVKEIDTEVKYSFVTRFNKRNPHFGQLDAGEFKSPCYMVRESDGRVASVMLSEFTIYMGVWDMTEKEFLIKFDKSINAVPFL